MTEQDNEIGINKVIQGDCIDVMRQMPDNFVDTIVTDPPYELTSGGDKGFMGKRWDGSGIAFNVEVWVEALRVAKPGATLLAFGGTRTYHRLVCAIEDAGWEIRDCISYFNDGTQQENAFLDSLDDEQLAAYMEIHYPANQLHWVYGSGFPKSLDIGKAIDKAKGAEREVVGIKTRPDGTQRPNRENWTTGIEGTYGNGNGLTIDKKSLLNANIETTPSTPLARTFSGYGTALKPAVEPLVYAQKPLNFVPNIAPNNVTSRTESKPLTPYLEPIVVAMKPLDGTYAENAEKWGVAGYWLDGGRVGTDSNEIIKQSGELVETSCHDGYDRPNATMYRTGKPKERNGPSNPKGRFPANLIHSNEPGVLREFNKAGVRSTGNLTGQPRTENKIYGSAANTLGIPRYYNGDTGSASRFFQACPPDTEPARLTYHPKASARERGNGNSHPTVKPLSLLRYLCRLTRTPYGGLVLDPFGGSGTTAIACISEKRDFILIEKETDYVGMARRRIAEYTGETIEVKEIKVKDETIKQMALW